MNECKFKSGDRVKPKAGAVLDESSPDPGTAVVWGHMGPAHALMLSNSIGGRRFWTEEELEIDDAKPK